MNNPDYISESLETIFWIKLRKFFDADPGSGMEKIRNPWSGIDIPDLRLLKSRRWCTVEFHIRNTASIQ